MKNSGTFDPAPFQGVLPLPLPALKSAWPVLGKPPNRNRTISLTVPWAIANASFKRERRNVGLPSLLG
jgi:hypothetical protein